MRRRPGRRLECAGEMERAEAGLAGQGLDGQALAEMGFDEFGDPPETPGIERAARRRQGYRGRLQAGMMPEDVNAQRRGERFDQHLSPRRRIDHLAVDRPRDLLDQRIAKPAFVMQPDSVGIDVDFP